MRTFFLLLNLIVVMLCVLHVFVAIVSHFAMDLCGWVSVWVSFLLNQLVCVYRLGIPQHTPLNRLSIHVCVCYSVPA